MGVVGMDTSKIGMPRSDVGEVTMELRRETTGGGSVKGFVRAWRKGGGGGGCPTAILDLFCFIFIFIVMTNVLFTICSDV